MSGQSINDRITAAKYSLAGQGLAKSVCKATTEEVIGPKKKHLEYLLLCTNEANVSIPQLANLLIERTQMQSWVTVFKALISVHHLMCYGNERFTQYLASSNCNFNLGGFLDKTGTSDQPQLSYDMSTFIRRYAKYINEKAISYRGVAFDFCKTKRGKDDGTLRTMPTDQLLKTLPILQSQLDALLDFDCTASELNNGVINCAFMLLFRDLIRLFACYNDGIINLLEKYFEMNKKQARDALDCYKKFLIRMDRVAEFLKVAENVGIDKGEIPDLKKAPSSLLDALEAHLASLEGKKGAPAGSTSNGGGVKLENAVSILNSTSSAFGIACSNGRVGGDGLPVSSNGKDLDEMTKRVALAEEEALYEKLKHEHSKNNPFLSSPGGGGDSSAATVPPDSSGQLDLFGSSATTQVEPTSQQPLAAPHSENKASDDLLQLGNPFADVLSSSMGAPVPGAFGVPQPTTQQPYTNGFLQQQQQQPSPFLSSSKSFEAVFGTTNYYYPSNNYLSNHLSQPFDSFGQILKPEGQPGAVGGAVPPTSSQPTQPQKLISGDLDMSLSSLVENLNIKGPTPPKNQFSSPKAQNKTGGIGWSAGAPAPVSGAYRQPGPIATGQIPQWGGPNSQPAPGMQQMGMMGGVPPTGPMSGVSGGQPGMPGSATYTSTPFDPLGQM